MNIPILCLFISALLLLLTKIPVGIAMSRQKEGYDNKTPRDQQAQLSGWGKRALAAHQNHFEAFPIFAAGVLVSQLSPLQNSWVSLLAIGFVICRILYTLFYILDWDKIRSLAWGLGLIASLTLIGMGVSLR